MDVAQPQLTPPTYPIPVDLERELTDPCPWRISENLFKEMKTQETSHYKKVQVLPTHPEWRFVWRYFHHDKPNRYGIKKIFCIHEYHQMKAFEHNLSFIEQEAKKFKATWKTEPQADQRKAAIERWQKTVASFSPFQTQGEDGRNKTWTSTKVLPLWHGSKSDLCNSICESGFVFFGKSALKEEEAGKESTDEGYFGNGIYFTNSARYASDIYSQGHLLLAWVSMHEPFPVIGDDKQLDMALLKGKGAYTQYNAHYVPVRPVVDSDPYCAVYHPCKHGEKPFCDEIVVFQKSQAMPRFWVELEIEYPYLMDPANIPLFVGELIPHLIKMLQRPEVDRDLKLRNVLNSELAILLTLSTDENLEEKHSQLFQKLTQLIDNVGKIDQNVRNALVRRTQPPPTQMIPTPLLVTPVAQPSVTPPPPDQIPSQPIQPPFQAKRVNKSPHPLPTYSVRTLEGHSHSVCSLAVLSDGTLASGSYHNTIKLWNPSTGECLRTLTGHSGPVFSLAVLSDGTLVSGSYDKTIKLWNPSIGACLRTLTGHSESVRSLAILGDGTLVSASLDKTIKLWNPSTGACLRTFTGHSDGVCSLAVLADETLASGSHNATIKLWNLSTGTCLHTLTGSVLALTVLADGTLVSASANKTIKLWNPSTRTCLRTLTGHSECVRSFAVLHDGTLASGSDDTTIKLWNPFTGACLHTLTGNSGFVYSLAVFADGTLASGSSDKTIKLWK